MFGNTHPIFEHETRTSERIPDRDLRDYLRWEYRPADRISVILSARGAAVWSPRARARRPRRVLRRLRLWMARVRAVGNAAVPAAETLPQDGEADLA